MSTPTCTESWHFVSGEPVSRVECDDCKGSGIDHRREPTDQELSTDSAPLCHACSGIGGHVFNTEYDFI
jgi:DnaJ-class molecular chaperone